MKISCRLFTLDDIDKLIGLWNENAEWGTIDQEQWKKVFYHTPYGPSTIVLATPNDNPDEVLAQFVFIPTRIYVKGKEISAFKPCAPIVKKDVRDDLGLTTLFSFIMKMYKFAKKHFISEGIYLLHIMPDVRWVRGFQMVPGIQVAHFPLWCLPLDKEIPQHLPGGYTIEDISPSDPRIDELWARSAKLHDCGIIRDTKFFPWKLSHRNYRFVAITNNSRLAGFAVFIYKDVIKGIIICDVLAEDEVTLALTIKIASSKASAFRQTLPEKEQPNCEKVSILATPLIEKIVSEMGFEKNKYKFSLAVHVLSKELSKKDVNPERWYVSAND
jgi:hypothetical protein